VGRRAAPMNVWCPLLPAVVHGSPFGCGPSTDRAGFRSRPVADAPVLGASRRERFDGDHSPGGRCSWLGREDRAGPPVGASTPTSPPAMVARIVVNESGTGVPLEMNVVQAMPPNDEVQAKGRYDRDIQPIGKTARATLQLHLHHLYVPGLLSSVCSDLRSLR